ncbi:MAG: hypothetical protein AAFU77_11135 [Myxococcota bacterium]
MHKAHILVACEDTTRRNVYAKQMRLLGARVRAVRTAEEAMAQTESARFDRVICSEQLGASSGEEVLRQVSLINEEAERILLGAVSCSWASRTVPVPFDFETLKSLVAEPGVDPRTRTVEERLEAVVEARDRRRRRIA